MKKIIISIILLIPSVAYSQIRANTDNCYYIPNQIVTCEGWASANSYKPNVNFLIGTIQGNWHIEYSQNSSTMETKRRDDVCNIIHSWPESCDGESWIKCDNDNPYSYYQSCVGYKQSFDISQLPTGWYSIRLAAWYLWSNPFTQELGLSTTIYWFYKD